MHGSSSGWRFSQSFLGLYNKTREVLRELGVRPPSQHHGRFLFSDFARESDLVKGYITMNDRAVLF